MLHFPAKFPLFSFDKLWTLTLWTTFYFVWFLKQRFEIRQSLPWLWDLAFTVLQIADCRLLTWQINLSTNDFFIYVLQCQIDYFSWLSILLKESWSWFWMLGLGLIPTSWLLPRLGRNSKVWSGKSKYTLSVLFASIYPKSAFEYVNANTQVLMFGYHPAITETNKSNQNDKIFHEFLRADNINSKRGERWIILQSVSIHQGVLPSVVTAATQCWLLIGRGPLIGSSDSIHHKTVWK